VNENPSPAALRPNSIALVKTLNDAPCKPVFRRRIPACLQKARQAVNSNVAAHAGFLLLLLLLLLLQLSYTHRCTE
jgi:hypothetical protein